MEEKSLPKQAASEPQYVNNRLDDFFIACNAIDSAHLTSLKSVQAIVKRNPAILLVWDDYGETLLHKAVKVNKAMVELLLQLGARIDIRARDGKTLFLYAIEQGENDAAEFLIDYCAERITFPDYGVLEIPDNEGNTPVHRAAVLGKVALLMQLLRYGCSIKCRNVLGNTPLHVAVMNEQVETAKVLLAAGADAEVSNALRFLLRFIMQQLSVMRLFAEHLFLDQISLQSCWMLILFASE